MWEVCAKYMNTSKVRCKKISATNIYIVP